MLSVVLQVGVAVMSRPNDLAFELRVLEISGRRLARVQLSLMMGQWA